MHEAGNHLFCHCFPTLESAVLSAGATAQGAGGLDMAGAVVCIFRTGIDLIAEVKCSRYVQHLSLILFSWCKIPIDWPRPLSCINK